MAEREYPKRLETRTDMLNRLWREDDVKKARAARTLHWVRECTYMSEVATKHGVVQEMNFSKQTFISYCRMQMAAAEREGFDDTVTYIQHCLDDLGPV